MAYLFVLNGRERYRVFQLTRDACGIGQRPDADLVVRDPWISWDHARVVREGAGWAIEDLGSTNGTYVDCLRVEQRRALFDDDVVFLGRTHFLFVASNRLPSAPPLRSAPSRSSQEARSFEATTRLIRQASDINVEPLVDEDTGPLPVEPVPGEWSEAADPANLPALAYYAPPPAGRASESREPIFVGSPLDHAGPIDALDAIEDDFLEIEGESSDDGPDVGEDGVAYDMAPPPPPRPRGTSRSASGVEIDVGDLLDSGGRVLPEGPPDETDVSVDHPQPSFSGAAPVFLPLDPNLDPIEARDVEIRRLRAALQARDVEVRRLRDEVRRLKEQYLDL